MQPEVIYKGATRSAMKLGVPLIPLVVLFGAAMLLIVWGSALVSWWVAVPVLFVLVQASGLDALGDRARRPAVSPDGDRDQVAAARPQSPPLALAQLYPHRLSRSSR